MKRKLLTRNIFILVILLMIGCASDTLSTPCPYFGENCKKIPVNSWDCLK